MPFQLTQFVVERALPPPLAATESPCGLLTDNLSAGGPTGDTAGLRRGQKRPGLPSPLPPPPARLASQEGVEGGLSLTSAKEERNRAQRSDVTKVTLAQAWVGTQAAADHGRMDWRARQTGESRCPGNGRPGVATVGRGDAAEPEAPTGPASGASPVLVPGAGCAPNPLEAVSALSGPHDSGSPASACDGPVLGSAPTRVANPGGPNGASTPAALAPVATEPGSDEAEIVPAPGAASAPQPGSPFVPTPYAPSVWTVRHRGTMGEGSNNVVRQAKYSQALPLVPAQITPNRSAAPQPGSENNTSSRGQHMPPELVELAWGAHCERNLHIYTVPADQSLFHSVACAMKLPGQVRFEHGLLIHPRAQSLEKLTQLIWGKMIALARTSDDPAAADRLEQLKNRPDGELLTLAMLAEVYRTPIMRWQTTQPLEEARLGHAHVVKACPADVDTSNKSPMGMMSLTMAAALWAAQLVRRTMEVASDLPLQRWTFAAVCHHPLGGFSPVDRVVPETPARPPQPEQGIRRTRWGDVTCVGTAEAAGIAPIAAGSYVRTAQPRTVDDTARMIQQAIDSPDGEFSKEHTGNEYTGSPVPCERVSWVVRNLLDADPVAAAKTRKVSVGKVAQHLEAGRATWRQVTLSNGMECLILPTNKWRWQWRGGIQMGRGYDSPVSGPSNNAFPSAVREILVRGAAVEIDIDTCLHTIILDSVPAVQRAELPLLSAWVMQGPEYRQHVGDQLLGLLPERFANGNQNCVGRVGTAEFKQLHYILAIGGNPSSWMRDADALGAFNRQRIVSSEYVTQLRSEYAAAKAVILATLPEVYVYKAVATARSKATTAGGRPSHDQIVRSAITVLAHTIEHEHMEAAKAHLRSRGLHFALQAFDSIKVYRPVNAGLHWAEEMVADTSRAVRRRWLAVHGAVSLINLSITPERSPEVMALDLGIPLGRLGGLPEVDLEPRLTQAPPLVGKDNSGPTATPAAVMEDPSTATGAARTGVLATFRPHPMASNHPHCTADRDGSRLVQTGTLCRGTEYA